MKHAQMAEQWCRTIAAQEASTDGFFGMAVAQATDQAALAGVVRDFLQSHGGAPGNQLPPAEASLEDLVTGLLAKYEHDQQRAEAEVHEASRLVTAAELQLRKQGEVLAFETRRADEAERQLAELRRKYAALQEGSASALAQQEAHASELMVLAGSSVAELEVHRRRLQVVQAKLEAIVHRGSPTSEVDLSAALLEALGIRSKEQVHELLESAAMQQEEHAQATAAALAAAGGKTKKKAGRGGGASSRGASRGKR